MPSVLITGANRGLGLEFVKQYLADGWKVHALARKWDGALAELTQKNPSLTLHEADVTDHASIDAVAATLKGEALDVLINNAGYYGPNFGGEGQTFKTMDYAVWRKAFEVNTLGPYKVTQAFVGNLAKGQQKKLVFISTGMASMEGMKQAGMISTAYQSTKAALNMTGVVLATELKDQGIGVLLIHPGWVKTDMGTQAADIAPETSIKGMRKVIEGFSTRDGVAFRDYTGAPLPW